MDPITKIGAAIGSSVTIVLLFGKTILSVKWWRRHAYAHFEALKSQGDQKPDSTSGTSEEMISESKTRYRSQSQSLVQVKLKWDTDNLLNKKVISSEMIEIGYICTLENQSMNIIGNGRNEKYVIPTYYVREYDDRVVLIDTSARYLDRYKVKEQHSRAHDAILYNQKK